MLTIVLLIIEKTEINTIVNYIFYVLISIASVILLLFFVTAGVCARLTLHAMMIFGVSLIVLITNLNHNKETEK